MTEGVRPHHAHDEDCQDAERGASVPDIEIAVAEIAQEACESDETRHEQGDERPHLSPADGPVASHR